jgi:hypothetical protein
MAIQTFTAGQVLTAAQMNSLQANDYNQTVSTKTASYTLVAADKGTRVVMNAAGATTITVNTSLFSAGDTVYLQNIGVGVSTVTAGTATVSSAGPLAIPQYGSGTLYFTSAGVSIYFPSAVTTTSSGLVVVKAETSFSSVASVTIDDIFTSTYRNYLIKTRFTFSNTSTVISARFRASGSSNSTANYGDQYNYITTTLTASRTNPSTGTSMKVMADLGAAGLVTDFTFYNPQEATTTQMTHNGLLLDGGSVSNFGVGGFVLTNQFDGFEIISSLGNITGQYTVYGLAKS